MPRWSRRTACSFGSSTSGYNSDTRCEFGSSITEDGEGVSRGMASEQSRKSGKRNYGKRIYNSMPRWRSLAERSSAIYYNSDPGYCRSRTAENGEVLSGGMAI
jgi:hypothetical protein